MAASMNGVASALQTGIANAISGLSLPTQNSPYKIGSWTVIWTGSEFRVSPTAASDITKSPSFVTPPDDKERQKAFISSSGSGTDLSTMIGTWSSTGALASRNANEWANGWGITAPWYQAMLDASSSGIAARELLLLS